MGWELAGEDSQTIISPFAWRVLLPLAYKGQSYESIPWRLTEKAAIKPFEKVRCHPESRAHPCVLATIDIVCLHTKPSSLTHHQHTVNVARLGAALVQVATPSL